MLCLLCEAKHLTKWYYKDDICYICDCLTCKYPMIVTNKHGEPSPEELVHLIKITEKMFPGSRWRGFRRSWLRDHWHEHIILEN